MQLKNALPFYSAEGSAPRNVQMLTPEEFSGLCVQDKEHTQLTMTEKGQDIYYCKAVGATEFDSLIFQVEWFKLSDNM